MGARSQRKGREFEVKIANWLSDLFGVSFRRVPRSGGIREFNAWDIMRFRGSKSVNPKRKTLIDQFGIECKNIEAKFPAVLRDWLDQTEEAAKDENLNDWMLFFHRPGTDLNYAIIPQETLSRLFRELQGFRDEAE